MPKSLQTCVRQVFNTKTKIKPDKHIIHLEEEQEKNTNPHMDKLRKKFNL